MNMLILMWLLSSILKIKLLILIKNYEKNKENQKRSMIH